MNRTSELTLTTSVQAGSADPGMLGELLRRAVFGDNGYRITQLQHPLVGRAAGNGDRFDERLEADACDAESTVHRGVWEIPAGGRIGDWEVSADTIVAWQWWWCGDGTLMFQIGAGDGRPRVVVNDDAKKNYGWRDVT